VSAGAAASPGIRPFGLARADLLKLRRRRGLFWTVTVLTIVPMVIAYGVLAILHAANPDHHGPAGGVENLGHGMFVLTLLGGVAAILAGARAGADDVASGVFRELVVTGRSRLALFAARIPAGLAFLWTIAGAGFAVAAIGSTAFAGSLDAPSARVLLDTAAWLGLVSGLTLLLALGVSSAIGSRGTAIGIVLGWQIVAMPVLLEVKALGSAREGLLNAATGHLAPAAVFQDTRNIGMSLSAVAVVIAAWALIPLALGAWRTRRRDA